MSWWCLLSAFGALAGINTALLIASLRVLERARRLRQEVTVEAARLRACNTELELRAEQVRRDWEELRELWRQSRERRP